MNKNKTHKKLLAISASLLIAMSSVLPIPIAVFADTKNGVDLPTKPSVTGPGSALGGGATGPAGTPRGHWEIIPCESSNPQDCKGPPMYRCVGDCDDIDKPGEENKDVDTNSKGWHKAIDGTWARCPDDDDGDDACYPIIPVNPRQVKHLTVATLTDMANFGAYDYRLPASKWKEILQQAEEFNTADIVEYNFMNEATDLPRRPVQINKENAAGMNVTDIETYRQYLEYLIRNNIISRDEVLVMDGATVYMTSRDYRKDNQNGRVTRGERTISKPNERYSKPLGIYAKSDFLADMSKTQEVLTGRPFLIRMNYTRGTADLRYESNMLEPIDGSPYRKYLGQLGIDSVQNDILINHGVYQETALITTNDVTEKYLKKLLEQGVIDRSEILQKTSNLNKGEISGDRLLESLAPASKDILDGEELQKANHALAAWEYNTPIRINYDKEALSTYEPVTDPYKIGKSIQDVTLLIGKDGTMPWGDTYEYSGLRTNGRSIKTIDFAGAFVKKEGVISKKNNYIHDPNGVGYRFFKEEKITLMDAYKLVYKFLKITEDEEKITEEMAKRISSAYALNLANMTAEEENVVQYLIAKGIVDGNDQALTTATSDILTNFKGIELIYRLKNKSYRINQIPEMSETDKEMASKGYSQATVRLSNGQNRLPSPVIETLNNIGVEKKEAERLAKAANRKSIEDSDLSYIYLRMPSEESSEDILSYKYNDVKLYVNDSSRNLLTPSKTINVGDKVWRLYKVPKTISNNLMAKATGTNQVYNWTGINGQGIYIIEGGSDTAIKYQLEKLIAEKDIGLNEQVDETLRKMLTEEFIETVNKDFAERNNQIKDIAIYKNDKQLDKKAKKVFIAKLLLNDLTPQDLMGVKFGDTKENKLPPEDTKAVVMSGVNVDQIPHITFKGQLMFSEDNLKDKKTFTVGSRTFALNDSALTSEFKNAISLVQDQSTKKVSLIYIPKDGPSDAAMVRLSKALKIPSSDGKDTKIPGYAKLQGNGKTVALISKEELKSFNIEAITDKNLRNTITGQQAFLNTTDNFTLIGNNITHYGEADIIVNTFGGEGKVYYNLEVIVELINDTAMLETFAGKNIFVSTPGELFKKVKIYDVSTKGGFISDNSSSNKNDALELGTTYLLTSKNGGATYSNDIYMSLSATGGKASNYIYYKNKDKDNPVSALIVYKPNTNRHLIKEIKDKTNNRLSDYVANRYIPTTALTDDKDPYKAYKSKILAALFKGGAKRDRDGDIIGGNYIYDIYLLTDGTAEANKKSLENFLGVISKDKFITVADIKSVLKIEGFGDLDIQNKASDIAIKPIGASKVFGSDLFEHVLSGNLYARITKNDKKTNKRTANTLFLKALTYQNYNLVEDTVARGSTKNTTLQIAFRPYRFFEDTPEGMIPLEVYGMWPNEYGRVERPDNKELINFGKDKKYKLPYYNYGSNNTFISKSDGNEKLEVGIGTKLELPYVELTEEELTKNGATHEELLNYLYSKTLEEFDKNTGTYKVKDALEKAQVGYYKSITPRDLLNLMKGTWDGVDNEKGEFNLLNKNGTFKANPNNAIFILGQRYGLGLNDNALTHINIASFTESKSYEYDTEGKKIPICYKTETVLPNGNVICKKPDGKTVPTNDPAISKEGYHINDNGQIQYKTKLVRTTLDTTKGVPNVVTLDGDMSIPDMLKSSYISKGGKIYLKPSIVIPAGTTLVDRDGNLEFLPAARTRSEVYYLSDIVNNIVSRINDKNEDGLKRIYLSDIPKGSIVRLPGGDKSFIKMTEPQEMGHGTVSWVKGFVTPKTEHDIRGLDTYELMYSFMATYGNMQIPYGNSTGTVYLKQTVNKALFNLPTKDELKEIKEYIPKATSKDTLTNVLVESEDYKDSFTAKPVTINSEGNVVSDDTAKSGMLMYKVFFSPTLEVRKVQGEEAYQGAPIYDIVRYHDISKFSVDEDNSYIRYLKQQDTPADEIKIFMDALTSSSLDGTPRAFLANLSYAVKNLGSYTTVMTRLILPVCIKLVMTYLFIMYVMLKITIVKDFIEWIYFKLGKDERDLDWLYRERHFLRVFLELLVLGTIMVIFEQGLFDYLVLKLVRLIIIS